MDLFVKILSFYAIQIFWKRKFDNLNTGLSLCTVGVQLAIEKSFSYLCYLAPMHFKDGLYTVFTTRRPLVADTVEFYPFCPGGNLSFSESLALGVFLHRRSNLFDREPRFINFHTSPKQRLSIPLSAESLCCLATVYFRRGNKRHFGRTLISKLTCHYLLFPFSKALFQTPSRKIELSVCFDLTTSYSDSRSSMEKKKNIWKLQRKLASSFTIFAFGTKHWRDEKSLGNP